MATKDDQDKIKLELIEPVLLEEVGRVLTFGAKKYKAFNWMEGNGLDSLRIYGSIQRHLNSWRDGENEDKESGLLHLSHAATELMFLLHFQVKGGVDTRPSKKSKTCSKEELHTKEYQMEHFGRELSPVELKAYTDAAFNHKNLIIRFDGHAIMHDKEEIKLTIKHRNLEIVLDCVGMIWVVRPDPKEKFLTKEYQLAHFGRELTDFEKKAYMKAYDQGSVEILDSGISTHCNKSGIEHMIKEKKKKIVANEGGEFMWRATQ